MPNVFGYCRISKGREVQTHSLDAQTSIIENTYKFKAEEWGHPKLVLPPFMDEKVSGRNVNFFKRPAAKRLVARLRAGDRVIVAKVDRAFRNTQDMFLTMDALNAMKVFVYFVDLGGLDTSTAIGRMIIGITTLIAEFEQRRLAERTREAMQTRKMLNMDPSVTAPIGWRWVVTGQGRPRKPLVDDFERQTALKAVKLAAQGLSNHQIAHLAWRRQWKKPLRIQRNGWRATYIARLIKAHLLNYPITDREAETGLELPKFKLEEGDQPIRPQGFFDDDQYPELTEPQDNAAGWLKQEDENH